MLKKSNFKELVEQALKGLFFDLWVIIKNTDCFAYIFISMRGGGKTYSVLKGLLQDKKNFIYVRRTENELISSMNKDLNPFKNIGLAIGKEIEVVRDGKFYYVASDVERNEKEKVVSYKKVANCFALSQIGQVKGLNFENENIDYILFDEFLPTKIKGDSLLDVEGKYFSDFMETVIRNNALIGLKEPRLIFLGNATTLRSGILTFYKLSNLIFELALKQRKGVNPNELYGYDSVTDTFIMLPMNKEFIKKKSNSRLYKFMSRSNYKKFALNNEFQNENLDNVYEIEHQNLEPLYSIDKYYFYKDKRTGFLYVSYRKHQKENYEIKLLEYFKRKHMIYIQTMIDKDKVIYSNYDLKNELYFLLK